VGLLGIQRWYWTSPKSDLGIASPYAKEGDDELEEIYDDVLSRDDIEEY